MAKKQQKVNSINQVREARIKEIDQQIDQLRDEKNEIEMAMSYDKMDELVAKVCHEWILVKGWSCCEEDTDREVYRFGYVDRVLSYEGNSSFRLQFKVLFNIRFSEKGKRLECVIVDEDNVDLIGDVNNCKVIKESKAQSLCTKIGKYLLKPVDKANSIFKEAK